MFCDLTARPLGHGSALEGLWRAADSGRLPHALMLRGPEGVGKFLSAKWLAAGLLCETGPEWPCGTCGPCKRVASGNHPDLFVVDAVASGENSITVPFITPRQTPSSSGYSGQAITQFLSLRAMEGGWRVVILRETERMNLAAQNAFLKTLEEPGPDTLLLLECSKPGALLDTIKSRVVPIAFDRLSRADAESVLAGQGLDPDEAAVLARWSLGAPGAALSLASRGAPELRSIVLSVARGGSPVVVASQSVWDVDGDFPGKTAAAQRRARVEAVLDVGLELWLDQERLIAGTSPDELGHGAEVAALDRRTPPEREARMDSWLEARADLALNVGPEALLDRALAACAP